MKELMIKQKTLDSREVAQMIGKEHKNLLRDIKGYIEILDGSKLSSHNFFVESTYTNSQNKEQPCFLLTRKGCDMVANKMTGEKGVLFTAEYVTRFEEMEKELNPMLNGNLKAILLIHAEVGELLAATSHIETRVESLENTMTIDYSQQLTLCEIAKHIAIESMGGKDTPSYKNSSLRSKVFSQVWKDFKEYFQVNSYKNTAVKDYEKAKEYLGNWKAQGKILREIEDCNNQIELT
ncbi:Rha family transcriptional regulator [Clostridium sp. YIM B02551]|uniref:Rha family transcriptional regulator n=1 Tax=Clostridium sp. YIM B02551 TaxID=2910679 RepID=UPI001EEA60F5|nr:Rha family transcriptional regulator [Clostridium sp. YIM B02551]